MCDAQAQESQEARVGVRLRAPTLRRHRARTWSDAAGLYPSHVSGISRGESTPHLPALLGMSPSRLRMVVLPICNDCAAREGSNTIDPPPRWPRCSVLSSSLTSRGVSATRRGVPSPPPLRSMPADLQSVKQAPRACCTRHGGRRQVCRPGSMLFGWFAPRQRAATRGISSPGCPPLQHRLRVNSR